MYGIQSATRESALRVAQAVVKYEPEPADPLGRNGCCKQAAGTVRRYDIAGSWSVPLGFWWLCSPVFARRSYVGIR